MDKAVEQIIKYIDTLDASITPRRAKIQDLDDEITEIQAEIDTLIKVKDDMKAILRNMGYVQSYSKWVKPDQLEKEKGNSNGSKGNI